jgi:hypothetical protein
MPKSNARETRLQKARAWLPTYNGEHLVRGYKKKFSVDAICALKELLELGAISPEEAIRRREIALAERATPKDAAELRNGPAGKNHEWVNGQLLQTNKKWSQFKQSQRQWIQQCTAEAHAAYVVAKGKPPVKSGKDDVLNAVYEKIEERGIWIPYGEFAAHVGKMVDCLNRRARVAENQEN